MSHFAYYRSTKLGRLDAKDGTRFRTLSLGHGDETVVVIPGIEDSVLHFEQVPWFWAWYYRPLADPGRRVVVLGRPRHLPEGTRTSGLAASYADAIGTHFGPVNVVGISMGGLIAQHLAALHPELVLRLVLAVTAKRVVSEGVTEGEQLAAASDSGNWHAFATSANRICFSGWLRALCAVLLFVAAPLFWLVQSILGGGRAARDFRISAEACRDHDGTELLRAIQAPTLVWGASGDCLFPVVVREETAAALPHGELVTIPGVHAAFLQARGAFHEALDDFLSRGAVPRGRSTDVEVAIVGSGFSGLGMAIRLKQEGRGSFLIFEKGTSIGGTWRDNKYPGCACDVPSHLYSFSFEQNPFWTRKYSPQGEIQEYLERCVDKYGLRRHVRLGNAVARADFDERRAIWTVTLEDGSSLTARHVVFGVGALSRPAHPKVDGLDQFRGRAFHSAEWDDSVSLEGKRVGVIGTGASAIQIVPQIAPQTAKLSVFQRTPPWVLPKPDRPITKMEQRLFAMFPPLQNLYRFFIYCGHELRVLAFAVNPKIMNALAWAARRFIRAQIPDPELAAKVTPTYLPGCKRILIANDYYPALARSNVEVVTDGIVRATEKGLVTKDGTEHELDVIVYGTGFRVTDLLTPLAVTGLGGVDLNDVWKSRMEAYLGTSISGFPNFYMLLGPNTGLGHSSMIYMIESQIEMVLRAMRAIERRGAASAHVKAPAQQAFNEKLQPRLQGSIWASGCQSWYLDTAGHNSTAWPGFTFEFRMQALAFDESKFEFDPLPQTGPATHPHPVPVGAPAPVGEGVAA